MQRILQYKRMRGASMPLILAAIVVGVIFIFVAVQSAGAMIDKYNVSRAAEKAVKGASNVRQARDIFQKTLLVEGVYTFKDEDLQFTETAQGLQVQWHFEREVHIAGPAYLVYRFQGMAQR